MARRKRTSGAEDVMDLVARMPWWAGIALAGASYLLFHWLATRPQSVITSSRVLAGNFQWIMVSSVSLVLQYVAPALCLVGAFMSLVGRSKREALAANFTGSSSAHSLDGMSWREFEMLVGEAFRLQGYEVRERGGAQPDGGVDLVLRKGNETFLVQCKQWKAFKVGVDVVRELYGVMAAEGAAGGFVVTSGRFTDDAVAFASGRNVRLVDGSKLFGLLKQAGAARADRAPGSSQPARSATPVAPAAAVSCPKCSAPMVKRTARKGTQAGAEFWGCSTFPACRGTR
jgi:restriction system protein